MTNVGPTEKRNEVRKLPFKAEGLDCQNAVRKLKATVGPFVRGDDNLVFSTREPIARRRCSAP